MGEGLYMVAARDGTCVLLADNFFSVSETRIAMFVAIRVIDDLAQAILRANPGVVFDAAGLAERIHAAIGWMLPVTKSFSDVQEIEAVILASIFLRKNTRVFRGRRSTSREATRYG